MFFLGILQARMSSSRLPGKVLFQVDGRPLLAYQCERLLRSRRVSRLVVATSQSEEDAQIEEVAASMVWAASGGH
jgi:spore coat polysaccharide biosynthesis protein SpsF